MFTVTGRGRPRLWTHGADTGRVNTWPPPDGGTLGRPSTF